MSVKYRESTKIGVEERFEDFTRSSCRDGSRQQSFSQGVCAGGWRATAICAGPQKALL